MSLTHEASARSRVGQPSQRPMRTVLILAALLSIAGTASAERQHTVKGGQSLEVIAKQYKVNTAELAAANGINASQTLRGGQVLTVPPEGVVIVTAGQTLSGIAHAHR